MKTPNKIRNTYVVRRQSAPNVGNEVEVEECLTFSHARRIAKREAHRFPGCRVSIDKYDWEGYALGEVDAFYNTPNRLERGA